MNRMLRKFPNSNSSHLFFTSKDRFGAMHEISMLALNDFLPLRNLIKY